MSPSMNISLQGMNGRINMNMEEILSKSTLRNDHSDNHYIRMV